MCNQQNTKVTYDILIKICKQLYILRVLCITLSYNYCIIVLLLYHCIIIVLLYNYCIIV